MSDAHRHAAIGEAFETKSQLTKGIKELRAEALNLGMRLESLGIVLRHAPETVVLDKRSFDGSVDARFIVKPSDLDSERLAALTDELRAHLSKQRSVDAVLGD
jgi:VIT1/CCC1 family predicted Fe2+/Mn2+ transporter